MESNAIVLVAGILFLAIAIVGGGFTLERIQVPPVPSWSRIASGVLGALFVGTFFYVMLTETDPDPEVPPGSVPAAGAETPAPDTGDTDVGGPAVYADVTGSVPAGGDIPLALTRFKVTNPAGPARVGDAITVEYGLRNVGTRPVTVSEQFVGARSPEVGEDGDDHEDFASANIDTELSPGETIETDGTLDVDQVGTWKVWPCFTLPAGECASEWEVVSIQVVE